MRKIRSAWRFAMKVSGILLVSTSISWGAAYTVTSAADSGVGTLRQALIDANSTVGVPDTVEFDAAVTTITLSSALPIISDTLIIDGTVNASLVEIDGNDLSGNGLRVSGTNCEVYGLYIHGFDGKGISFSGVDGIIGATGKGNVINDNTGNGIEVYSPVVIEGNIIGTDSVGSSGIGNGGHGIQIETSVTACTIQDNVISGNATDGINNNGGDNVEIYGNIIGLAPDGDAIVGNGADGIEVSGLASAATIGSLLASDRNIVSGNGGNGIYFSAFNGVIQGNYVGTDITGLLDRGNEMIGITIGSNATFADAIRGNVVSGNTLSGVKNYAVGVEIMGNIIGLGADGDTVVGNDLGVMTDFAATGTQIGSSLVSDRNIISGNDGYGVLCLSANTIIEHNYIGTDATGLLDRGNGSRGVVLPKDSDIVRYNVISGNDGEGVFVDGDDNKIYGNIIGLASDGNTVLGNDSDGIEVYGTADSTVIGGLLVSDRNTISGNGENGIHFLGTNGTIVGNYIGTDTSGFVDRGNGQHGIECSQTVTGTMVAITQNTIAHSTLDNIFINTVSDSVSIGENSIDGDCRYPISFNGTLVANDALDADTGANEMQNFPVIDATDSSMLNITGVIDSETGTLYTIHLFENLAGHVSGNGPGETYLGSTTATTDGSGHAAWSISAGPVSSGKILSALAVDPTGNTSHFSPNVTVTVSAGIDDWEDVEY